jgi:hypothetical protein
MLRKVKIRLVATDTAWGIASCRFIVALIERIPAKYTSRIMLRI